LRSAAPEWRLRDITTITTTTESPSTTAGITIPTTTAGPATATAISRPIRRYRALVAALALTSAAAIAACGSSGGDEETPGPAAPANPAAFAWLHPEQPRRGWKAQNLPSGNASLAYPRSWRLIKTDPGTVTAALHRDGEIVGYLNITPQSGDETLANWAGFRPAHNTDEGDLHLVPLASASGLGFRHGTGSCVKDEYATDTGHQYREIACIVRGPSATSVVVGSAPPAHWAQLSPILEQAVSSFDARG
jgi:hypothetical protein